MRLERILWIKKMFKSAFRVVVPACVLLILSVRMLPAGESQLSVDASSNEGVLDNIAAGINFWGQQEARDRFRNEIGAKLYRLKLRLDKVEWNETTGTYNAFTLDSVSTASEMDVVREANEAAASGCKVMVQIYGIPKWLSTSQDERVVTNALPNYAKYPPQDYYTWAQIVISAIQTLHRVGLQNIDYFEIFGEPNVGSTWYQQMMPCKQDGVVQYGCEPNELGHNTSQVMENFLRIYRATALAIQEADPDAQIGGPAIVPNITGIWWTRYLCYYFSLYGIPFDFYSWHWYGIDEAVSAMKDLIAPYEPLQFGLVRKTFEQKLRDEGFDTAHVTAFLYDIYDYLVDLEGQGETAVRRPYSFVSSNLKRIMMEEGYGNNSLFLTEWSVNGSLDRRHDTHYGASFIVRALMDVTDSVTELQSYYCLSNDKPYYGDYPYGGLWNLFTRDDSNTPKASFNAFKVFSRLGDGTQRLSVSSSNSDVYATATKTADRITVSFTHYVLPDDPKNPDYTPYETVTLDVGNIPFTSYTYDVYLIDGTHSNSYYGSGPELEVVDSGTGTGGYQTVMDVSIYGVVMVEITQSLP